MKIDAKQAGKVNQQRTYWELEVPNDRNVGILLQHGGDGQLYYDGATGDVLDTNKKTVSSCTSLLAGSILHKFHWPHPIHCFRLPLQVHLSLCEALKVLL